MSSQEQMKIHGCKKTERWRKGPFGNAALWILPLLLPMLLQAQVPIPAKGVQGTASAPPIADPTATSAVASAASTAGVKDSLGPAASGGPDDLLTSKAAGASRQAERVAEPGEPVGLGIVAQVAKLAPLTGTDIDVPKRSRQILASLNEVMRFYRAALMPAQKIGEPSDVLYAEQASTQAMQIAQLAFEAAKNEAALLAKVAGPGGAKASPAPATSNAGAGDGGQGSQTQRVAAILGQAQTQLAALEAQQAGLEKQIAAARGTHRAQLTQQQEQVEGGLELQRAMVDALGRISSFSEAQNNTGLAGEIDRLQRSAPELLSKNPKPLPATVLESLASARDSGVTSQATVLFSLLSTLRSIDSQTKAVDIMLSQASDLRTPFVKVLRSTVQQGQVLTQQAVNLAATPTSDTQDRENTRAQFDTLTTTFRVLAGATLPLNQEIVLLENTRGTLTTWRAAVNAEYKEVLRSLLTRVLLIAIVLGILAVASNLWSRATVRYVSDLRRRRQLLFIRRAVIGFLSGLVVIFGLVTQFSSLATFAGFISAGIAVGLQSILLSVAAYFFIVGRYGVRVGDRITVAGVTGDVVEVGLVRFYLMELVGTGTELHATGRVAVFANSVLFQTGTPLYKQMPGTEYAWHEMTAKLKSDADVPAVTEALLKVVDGVYAGYKERIEAQQRQVEAWMGTALPAPRVESRLQLVEATLQFAVLFPVQLHDAAATDQKIAEQVVAAANTDGPLKAGLPELPVIKAAVKS